ncbi:MAG: hemolysin family protein [Acidaminococcaceae bacterium]|nr:hemolysin family protein [Acidaminococcaceae bacterium]MDO4935095.1 hemolysin family protein [Phascolarctobacterium sp.]
MNIDLQTLKLLIVMVFFLCCSAFFSAAETAFSAINKTHLRALAEDGNKRAAKTLQLVEDYDKLISTILIGNNIVNIALASTSALLFVNIFKNNQDLGATLSSIFATIAVLIFGEVTPKTITIDRPSKTAMFTTPAIAFFEKLFTPFTFFFSHWKNLIYYFIGKDTSEQKMSQQELMLLFDDVQDSGTIDENEGELLKNALTFNDTEVQEILTHRVDIKAADINATKEEIIKLFDETKLSRLIIYEKNIDKVVGVLHQKDLYVNGAITDKSLQELITKPIFTHPTEKIDDLLRKMQKQKTHLAIIVDEYGGTYGLVTVEDILEELVGDIWDDHDLVENDFTLLTDNTYVVNGKTNFEDFCHHFNLKANSGSTSVAGWVMEMMGKIPAQGDSFTYKNLTVAIEKVNDKRIRKVKVTINPE